MTTKKIPVRTSKIAEDYAKKVRVEPPKPNRQEGSLAEEGKSGLPGQHDTGPAQKPKNKKYPEGGKSGA